jgi:ribosome-binding factor A
MIGSQLQQELMSIIMRELNDPRLDGFPSITRVKVASDLSTADVFVTIMGTEGKQTAALNALKHSAGMMRQKLQKSLPLRTVPFLKFHLDEALRTELSVLNLIDKAVKEEDNRRAEREGPTAEGQPAEGGEPKELRDEP